MFNKFQILIKILVEFDSNKRFTVKMLKKTCVDSRARTSRSHLTLSWSQALWNEFGSSRLEDEDRQEDLSLFSLFSLDLV